MGVALSKVAVAAYVSLGLTLLSLFGSWYAEHSQFVLKSIMIYYIDANIKFVKL